MTLTGFLEHFRGVRQVGQRSKWTMQCPAHDDRSRNTLHLALGVDGRRLVICRAGCRIADVLAAATLTARDLFEVVDPERSVMERAGRRRPESLTAVFRETLRQARAQMASYGPLYALGDEIRATGTLVRQARRLADLQGPDVELAWELAELAAQLERDLFALEAEQDQVLVELRRG